MLKTFNSKKLMFTALAVIPIVALMAFAAIAGGPENSDIFPYKKGKIKGILTVERDPNDDYVSISLVGKCMKKDYPEAKDINETFCSDCWMTSELDFASETETTLLERVRRLDVDLPGCLSDEFGTIETLEITDIREFWNVNNTITATVTLRALQ